MRDDVLRARLVERLRTHFPEASPTTLGLIVIDLRDVVMDYAEERVELALSERR